MYPSVAVPLSIIQYHDMKKVPCPPPPPPNLPTGSIAPNRTDTVFTAAHRRGRRGPPRSTDRFSFRLSRRIAKGPLTLIFIGNGLFLATPPPLPHDHGIAKPRTHRFSGHITLVFVTYRVSALIPPLSLPTPPIPLPRRQQLRNPPRIRTARGFLFFSPSSLLRTF